jgi:hypothetical protein
MKYAISVTIIVVMSAGLVYGIVSMSYLDDIERLDADISLKSRELAVLLIPVTTPPPPTTKPPPVESVDLKNELCLRCHDRAQVESFHFPARIKAVEEKKERPIRICTTCHGESAMFVHFAAIQEERLKCETCHIMGGGGFIVPEKGEENLVVCEICHSRGNYIKIHIDGLILEDATIDSKWITKREGGECTICHNEGLYGGRDILKIHAENAADAGTISKTAPSQESLVPEAQEEFVETNKTAEWSDPAAPTTVIKDLS